MPLKAGAAGHHPGKVAVVVQMVDRETFVLQDILHNLDGLIVQLFRLHVVKLAGHIIYFAEAVLAAQNLAAEHLLILQRVLIQPAHKA